MSTIRTATVANVEALPNLTWDISTLQHLPRRNRIINGQFNIQQRGDNAYGQWPTFIDCWQIISSLTSVISATRGQTWIGGIMGEDGIVDNNPLYYASVQINTPVANAAGYTQLAQALEDVVTTSNKTFTLSFYARCVGAARSLGISYTQRFNNLATGDVNGAIGKATLTSDWQQFVYTFTTPSITGKTVTADENCLILRFWVEAGSNFNALTGGIGQIAGRVDITNVQLEDGAYLSPFEERSLTKELALCRRFFETSYRPSDYKIAAINNGCSWVYLTAHTATANAYTAGKGVTFAVPKRTSPGMAYFAPSTAGAGATFNASVVTCNQWVANQNGFSWYGTATVVTTNISAYVHWTASSEYSCV